MGLATFKASPLLPILFSDPSILTNVYLEVIVVLKETVFPQKGKFDKHSNYT